MTDRFQKRDLILDDSWVTKDGQTNPSYVAIEFSGERMAQLDMLMPGMKVAVEAIVSGREYQGRYYTTLRGMSATPIQPQQPVYPQHSGTFAPQQAYGQSYGQPAYQQPMYNQPQQFTPQQPQQPTYGQPQQPAYPQQPQQMQQPSFQQQFGQPIAPTDESPF